MFHIILFQPEIPPNTDNIIRLCANTESTLHLIKPLGFFLDDKHLKRASLDYIQPEQINTHVNLAACLENNPINNLYALSTKGTTNYSQPSFKKNDAFLFGPETRGLPQHVLDGIDPHKILRLPMSSQSRSINLANCVSIQVYEAWRQNDFNVINEKPQFFSLLLSHQKWLQN